jgi:RNA polymerase sigma-70 factor (ECF subfamily)
MDSTARLLKALARALSRDGEEAEADTAKKLVDLVDVAKGAWPDVELDPEELVVYLAERLDGHASLEDAVAKLERLHVGDLYLACACARGERRAVAAFDEQLLSQVAQHVRKVCQADDDVDEIRQILRTRMLVNTGDDKPRILSYGGRGPLGGWLRVAAVRVAQDLRRSRGAAPETDAGDETRPAEAAPMDPELAVMKARYGHHFRSALHDVLAGLPDRERNILAMSVIDGLSTDAIGALYRVNGSTVRRWLAQARERVLEEVRARLKTTLNIRPTEFDSLMVLVRSQIDLNLSQLLLRPATRSDP